MADPTQKVSQKPDFAGRVDRGGQPPRSTRPISGGSVGGVEVVAGGERVVASGQ